MDRKTKQNLQLYYDQFGNGVDFLLFRGILEKLLRLLSVCMSLYVLAIWSIVSLVHGDGNIILCSNERKISKTSKSEKENEGIYEFITDV